MNIKVKDTFYSKATTGAGVMSRVPLSSPHFSSDQLSTNLYKKRPLKSNSQNLSFEGLFYKPVIDEATKAVRVFDADEILELTQKHLGSSAKKLFESVRDSKLTNEMFSVNEKNQVQFHKKSMLKLIIDGMLYPITILPADALNGIVGALTRIKPLKNWAEGIHNSPMFKNIRQRSKIDSKVNALRGLFETVEDNKGKSTEELSSVLFQRSVKMFDSKTGNYDTKHERSLNRIVSGMVPAAFLANDAYNLSRMCDDNKKEAKQEKKIRFRQEVSRVGVSAYLTLVTMGALSKYINNSKLGIVLMTGSTVLFTEMFSRLTNGKHIVRLSPEKAKAINAKEAGEEAEIHNDYKSIFFKSAEPRKSFIAFNSSQPTRFKGGEAQAKKEPLLSFSSIMKASAIVIATGFSIKLLRKIPAIDKPIKNFFAAVKKQHRKLTMNEDYSIEKSRFDEILAQLKQQGFDSLALKYEEIAKNANAIQGARLHLGAKSKKIKPVFDFVIAPFKFAYDAISLPYRLVDNVVKSFLPKVPEVAKSTLELDVKALQDSIENIGKEALRKNLDPEKFKTYVNDNILKAFNVDNMSGISNSELSNLAKVSAAAATLWFLMADNYNMVMLKSNGTDKDGAELKFKERFVQESSRLFYQTLLIQLFNDTFKSQYHRSLWGMTWITASCTLIGEALTRKSVGVPLGEHSRDEIFEFEKERQNTTGFLKSYYNFMSRLTGKKSLAEMQEMKQGK